MNRILITGASGFVGNYLIKSLCELDKPFDILCISRNPYFDVEKYKSLNLNIKIINADLNNYSSLENILKDFHPDSVFHLASDSSVSHSWVSPIESFLNNTNIFLNLVESIRKNSISCRILSIGSSEEYGIVDPKYIPLIENSPLNPVSPYAVARVSQELLSKVYSDGYGMDIVMTRSFNHIGPGQRDAFVVSSFAKQITLAQKYQRDVIMRVGNIEIIRDFLDVRDVVRAYIILMQSGRKGEIYNICSGFGYSLKDILLKMKVIACSNIEYLIDKELIRPSDNPVIIGDNSKISQELGWNPQFTLERSLSDIIEYWKQKIS